MGSAIVHANDVRVHYPLFKGFLWRLLGRGRRYVRAVDGVSFEIQRGEIFGLVGESGCGKSTVGRALLGLAPVTGGEIVLDMPEGKESAPRRIRPAGLRIAVAVIWTAAALAVANAASVAWARGSFLPLGLMESIPAGYSRILGIASAIHAGLAVPLFLLAPWSRRPVRVAGVVVALLSFATLPWGLIPMGFQAAVVLYLGTPGPVGLLRRGGWVVPATRFRLDGDGVVEGDVVAEAPSSFERWFLGNRAVPTTGFSWIVQQLRSCVQIIYQDPHAALNPAIPLGEAIEHALRTHWPSLVASGWAAQVTGGTEPTPDALRKAAQRLLDDVGLRPADQFYAKRSTELSGGQKQRAVIARAIAPQPYLLVADEPVALLDMSIRAKILELLLDLKRRYGLTYVFITHDLATAKLVCDRIAIMYLGRIVEMGPAARIYADPKHPYTKALLQAIPIPDPSRRGAKVLPKGEIPDAVRPPAGCRFHPRCPVALPTCGWEGRDFVDYLEERRLDPRRSAQEEADLGAIDEWTEEGHVVRRHVRKADPTVLTERVRRVLAEAPAPLAGAVDRVEASGDEVAVRFRTPALLGPREVGGRVVECLLYDHEG